MKTLKAKDIKPTLKQDKLLNNLIRTSKNMEIYDSSTRHNVAEDGLKKPMVEKENYD